jgi:CheY-like chemotaxis protein
VVDLERPDEIDYGLRIVEEVRADPELAAFPIIVCTGAAESHLRPLRGRLNLLGVPILPKPFTLHEFEAALDRLLGGTASPN